MNAIADFRTSRPMLLHIFELRDQCYCNISNFGTNAVADFRPSGPMLLHIFDHPTNAIAHFRTSGPMLLQHFDLRDQCCCRFSTIGTNAIAHFRTSGTVGTNAIACFRASGAVGTNAIARQGEDVNGAHWCKRVNFVFSNVMGFYGWVGIFPYTNWRARLDTARPELLNLKP